MEEIKFETEFLNEYFREKTLKEKFTLEDIRETFALIDGNDGRISQNDLDILMQLSSVYFLKIDLSGLKLRNANLNKLTFSNCTITDCIFENCNITEINIDGCETESENINLLKQVGNLKTLRITGKLIINTEKIKQEYPSFNEMNLSEKRRIATDPANDILEDIDISSLYELPELEELDIERIKITNDQLRHFDRFPKLRSLSITETEINPEIEIPKIETLKELMIDRVQDLKTIKNLSEVENLVICQHNQKVENTEILKDFTMLETLRIEDWKNVAGVIPNAIKLKDLILNGCGISDISLLEKYPNLNSVDLQGNNLTESSLEDLRKIRKRVEYLNFEETPIADMLKGQEIAIANPDMAEKIRKIFGVDVTLKNINQYDLFVSKAGAEQAKIGIQGKEVLKSLIDTGLISNVKSQKIEMQLENLEGLPEEAIEYIANCASLKLQIQSFRGLNNGVLEKISKNQQIHYFVEDDLKTSMWNDSHYIAQDMKNILEVMETIKQSLPENATDIQKFMTVYKAIAMSADYDYSGCYGSEECTQEAQELTRSLKGVLLEGRAVCRGYAVALKKCLDYVGIESEVISGYAYDNPENSHAWNQVKIDGKWYNADLTWDRDDICKKKPLEYCLKNDDEFYKEHTVDRTLNVEQCIQDYSREEIQQQLEKMHSELDEHCENFGKGFSKLVGISEYKENANQHRLDNTTYEEIKSLIKTQSQNIELQQDMEQGE